MIATKRRLLMHLYFSFVVTQQTKHKSETG